MVFSLKYLNNCMQCNMFKRQHVSNKKKKVAEIKNSFSSVHNVELGNLMKEEDECFKHAKFRIKHHLLSSLIVLTAVLAVCHGQTFTTAATVEITTAATKITDNGCRDDGKYVFYSERRNFSEANDMCDSNNQTLAMPKTLEEMIFLAKFLRSGEIFFSGNTWIGLLHSGKKTGHGERIFHWVDNTPLNYERWSLNPPNPDNRNIQNCGSVYTHPRATSPYFWDDLECSKRQHFVCENPNVGPTCGNITLGYSYHSIPTTKAKAQEDCMSRGQELMKPMCQAQIDDILNIINDSETKTKELYTGHNVHSVPADLWMKGMPRDWECGDKDCDCVGLNLTSRTFYNFECGHFDYKIAYVCAGLNVSKCEPPGPQQECFSTCIAGYICHPDGYCTKPAKGSTEANYTCDSQSDCCYCIPLECSNATSDATEIPCPAGKPYICNNRGEPDCYSMSDLCVESKTSCPDEDAKRRCSAQINWSMAICRQGWQYKRRSKGCYKYIDTAMNYTNAEHKCVSIGGKLTHPTESVWELAHNNGHCKGEPLWVPGKLNLKEGVFNLEGFTQDLHNCFTVDHHTGNCTNEYGTVEQEVSIYILSTDPLCGNDNVTRELNSSFSKLDGKFKNTKIHISCSPYRDIAGALNFFLENYNNSIAESDVINELIVISDGRSQNRSLSHTVTAAKAIHDMGIAVLTISVGESYNPAEMAAVATNIANHISIESYDDLPYDKLEEIVCKEAFSNKECISMVFSHPYQDKGIATSCDDKLRFVCREDAPCYPPCRNGGLCVGNDTCECLEGFKGPHCEDKVVCNITCYNGYCCGDDTCCCYPGWTGDECQYGICKVWTDPHFMTFDGRSIDFQGVGRFVMAKDCDFRNDNFTINTCHTRKGTKHETIEYKDVSFVDSLHVYYARDPSYSNIKNVAVQTKMSTQFNRGRVAKKLEEKEGHDIHKAIEPNDVEKQFMHVKYTNHKIEIKYNFFNKSAFILVHKNYQGQMCGLCGNFDGDPNNDLMMESNQLADTDNQFGESWKSPKDISVNGRKQAYYGECPDGSKEDILQRKKRTTVDYDCYDDKTSYRGDVNKADNNFACENWNDEAVKDAAKRHGMEYTSAHFPDDSIKHNFCRFPRNTPSESKLTRPWCWIKKKKKNWRLQPKHCDVYSCSNWENACFHGSPINYIGNLTKSESGKKCLKWNHRLLNGYRFKPKHFPHENSVDHNYCRVPLIDVNHQHQDRPWCFVQPAAGPYGPKKEYCGVAKCPLDKAGPCKNKPDRVRAYATQRCNDLFDPYTYLNARELIKPYRDSCIYDLCAGCENCPGHVLAMYLNTVSFQKNDILDAPYTQKSQVQQHNKSYSKQKTTTKKTKPETKPTNNKQRERNPGAVACGAVLKAGIGQGFVVSALVLILKL